MSRGAESPHLKPLPGLANPFARVSPWTLPPQGQDSVGKMADIYGSQARKGPDRWSCICFASRGHSIASPDSASLFFFFFFFQLLFTCYPNGVISKKSFHAPRSIGDAEGVLVRLKGGRLVMSDPNLCSCRHKR